MTWLDDRLEEAGTLQILTYLQDGPPVSRWLGSPYLEGGTNPVRGLIKHGY